MDLARSHKLSCICNSRFFNMLAGFAALIFAGQMAHAQLRVVNYNVASLNGDLVALQGALNKMHGDDARGFAVPVSVFIFQEVQSTDIANLLSIVNAAAPVGVSYVQATYTNNGENGVAGAQAMMYRSDLLTEDPAGHLDIFTGAGRESDRWLLKLNVSPGVPYDSPDASFYVYGQHLKASQGTTNEQKRLTGVQSIRADSDTMPVGSHILYAGDFNLYTNAEPAYQEYTIPVGVGKAIDPLGPVNWTGAGGALKHTQSPCISGCSLVGGGLDDRFDFQLSTAPFQDGMGLSLITGSYRTVGNDGFHYNTDVNAGNNTYFPTNIPLSNALANDLHVASDHMPVMADYQIPAVMDVLGSSSFGRVIQGASASVFTVVQNLPPVTDPSGADDLQYTATGTGAITGVQSGTVAPLSNSGPVALGVVTGTVGSVAGTVEVSSSSQGAHNASISVPVTGEIVRPSNPSFDGVVDTNSLVRNDTFDADTGIQSYIFNVYNLGFDANQALLDLDSLSGLAFPFTLPSGLSSGIGGVPAQLILSINTAGLTPGLHEAVLSLGASDENIPGESSSVLSITWSVTINGVGVPCPGDITPPGGNGTVNIDDLVAVLNAFGSCPGCPEDITPPGGNGVVNIDDLVAVLNAFGACP